MCLQTTKRSLGIRQHVFSNEGFINRSAEDLPQSKIGQGAFPNGVETYAIGMSQYVQESVKSVEKYLHDRGLALLEKASTPLLTK